MRFRDARSCGTQAVMRKRKFDFAALFETTFDHRQVLYPTMKAHLDSMRSGKKPGLSMVSFGVSYMTDRGVDYLELLELAFERGLVVVLHNNWIKDLPFERQHPTVLVARPEELWRVPAWIALWDSAIEAGGWTDSAEAMSSLLLGYSAKQRAAWLKDQRHRRAAWGAATVYALLDEDQRARVTSLGQRGFGRADEIDLLLRNRDHGLRRGAFRRIPRGLTLARVAIDWAMFRELFGSPPDWRRRQVITARVPKRRIAAFHRFLRSNVQLLTARGWR
jgi:hypothetical protein